MGRSAITKTKVAETVVGYMKKNSEQGWDLADIDTASQGLITWMQFRDAMMDEKGHDPITVSEERAKKEWKAFVRSFGAASNQFKAAIKLWELRDFLESCSIEYFEAAQREKMRAKMQEHVPPEVLPGIRPIDLSGSIAEAKQ